MTKADYSKTYWNSRGTHQTLIIELQNLIPTEGKCSTKTPKLEKLRKAINAYYDLYNNGGCNLTAQIRASFGVGKTDFNSDYVPTAQAAIDKIEQVMDELVWDAAPEANV